MVQNIAEKVLEKGCIGSKYRGCKDTSKGKPKTVCHLSTAHAANMTNTTARDQEGNMVQKPTCILSYNAKMGGVDMIDQ